jgi:hypothetical protein
VAAESLSNRAQEASTEIKVAAAALTAAVSPPLGVAVAAGAALRSPRVRGLLRKGAVQALTGAIDVGERVSGAVRDATSAAMPGATPERAARANGRAGTAARPPKRSR